MPSLCIFELFKQPEVYFVGETIEGTITLKTSNDKQIEDMAALLRGEGKVRFQENYEGDETCKLVERTVYKGNEIYFFKIIRLELVGLLPAGSYKYNIRFTLDEYCLTSCETERGYIRYEISLIISRKERYNNVFKHGVTVIHHDNLNIGPTIKQPIQSKSNNKACCRMSKKRFCTLRTPVAVYAPGQVLKYTLAIHNTAKKKNGGFLVRLLKKMSFISKSPVSKVCTTRYYIVNKFVPAERLSGHRVEDAFLIPSTPPTTLSSKIIHIEYMLEVKVTVNCCLRSDLSAAIPIAIVPVPIKDCFLYSQFSGSRSNLKSPIELLVHQTLVFQLKSQINDCTANLRINEVTDSSINKQELSDEVDEEYDSDILQFGHYRDHRRFYIRGARIEDESAVFSTPFMDYDIQLTTSSEARKHKRSAAPNLPHKSNEEEPRIVRLAKTQGRAAALSLPIMGYKKKVEVSWESRNGSSPSNFPFMGHAEQPSTSRGAKKQKLDAAALMDSEDKPSTYRAAKKREEAAALNSPFKSYEKQPSRFCASRNDEELVALNLPIEIDALRVVSMPALLPPNDFMKPTSFEIEPYAEPPFEDDDVPECDRLMYFRPLYPVYIYKYQPASNYQNFKAEK